MECRVFCAFVGRIVVMVGRLDWIGWETGRLSPVDRPT